jgi:hypothetical protein
MFGTDIFQLINSIKMTLREVLLKAFSVDLPISGGNGNAIDNAIIIEPTDLLNDYTSIEYEVLRYIGMGRQVEWKLLQQSLVFYNGLTIDKLQIETRKIKDSQIITAVENHYFDITSCIGKSPETSSQRQTENTQADIDSDSTNQILKNMLQFVKALDKTIDKDNLQ